LTGTNVVTVHWDIELTNRQERAGHNSGVTVLHIEEAKWCRQREFVFDLGENFRFNWGAA